MQSNAVFYAEQACCRRLQWDGIAEETVTVNGGGKFYCASVVCYRKKFRQAIRVVRQRFWERRKKRWRALYYCSTDTAMSPTEILTEYRRRTQIEHVHQDAKLLAGFNDCRLRSARSIEGFLSLSLLSVGLLEWIRFGMQETRSITTQQILTALDLHWYKPMRLTRGLLLKYAAWQLNRTTAVDDFRHEQNSTNTLSHLFFNT